MPLCCPNGSEAVRIGKEPRPTEEIENHSEEEMQGEEIQVHVVVDLFLACS